MMPPTSTAENQDRTREPKISQLPKTSRRFHHPPSPSTAPTEPHPYGLAFPATRSIPTNSADATTFSKDLIPPASCADVPVTPLRASPTPRIRIAGTMRNAVIDTGSAITCLSTRSWPQDQLPARSPWRLRSATGQVSPLYGPVNVPFDLNNHVVEFPVFLADIADECF